MRWPLVVVSLCSLCICLNRAPAEEPTSGLLKDVRAVGKEGAGSAAARGAWNRIVSRGPEILPQILAAMDSSDTAVTNWLRLAFDRVAEPALKNGGKGIDVEALLAIARDPRHQGRARRLALEIVDQLRPGTSAQLIPAWLDDPEFRFEAVDFTLKQADRLAKQGKPESVPLYRTAFTATRDMEQAKILAGRLQSAGVTVSVAEHFGFLTDWYVIGPFDAAGMKGFKTSYPPEAKVDLKAELQGKDDKLTWKHFRIKESPAAAPQRVVLVNLLEPIGPAEDAVAFAYTAIKAPEAREVEFRGAADDNFTVWVNGERVFGFEEYRNGVRLDRHRFRVKLRQGTNTVLVKICQAPLDPTNPEPNWEFLLRIVDLSGSGIVFANALPRIND